MLPFGMSLEDEVLFLLLPFLGRSNRVKSIEFLNFTFASLLCRLRVIGGVQVAKWVLEFLVLFLFYEPSSCSNGLIPQLD